MFSRPIVEHLKVIDEIHMRSPALWKYRALDSLPFNASKLIEPENPVQQSADPAAMELISAVSLDPVEANAIP